MIDFSDKTVANLLAQQLERVTEEIDKREGSLIQTALGPASYALEEAYLDLARVQANGFVQTATAEALDYKAAEVGLGRYPASAAVRRGIFNCSIQPGARFATNAGADMVCFVAEETLEDGGIALRCETLGTAGNAYTGELLAITYIPGLTSARVTDILIPGQDAESDSALRARFLEYVSNRPFGGNIADYRLNIGAMSGIGSVQVYPTWNGGGTVKCAILGADYLPASDILLEQVQTQMDPLQNSGEGLGLAPIGAKVLITTPDAVQVDITAVLTVANGYTLEQLRDAITARLEEYLDSLRREWAMATDQLTYGLTVYRARVMAAMLAVKGVINVEKLTLAGLDEDMELQENGLCQQVPVLGAVTLHGN